MKHKDQYYAAPEGRPTHALFKIDESEPHIGVMLAERGITLKEYAIERYKHAKRRSAEAGRPGTIHLYRRTVYYSGFDKVEVSDD